MSFTSKVIPMGESQSELLANVLSNVLCNEPLFTYLIPDADQRHAALPRLCGSAIQASRSDGRIYTTADVEGASLWIGPGRTFAIQKLLRTRSRRTTSEMSWTSLKRSLALAAWTEEIRERLAGKPHWYLLVLGVQSSKHERALREALVEPVLARADADCVPCYLETFHESNLSFYEQQGFRIEAGGRVPDGGPPFWAMVRLPVMDRSLIHVQDRANLPK